VADKLETFADLMPPAMLQHGSQRDDLDFA
jgi:hypothetical protein